MKTQASKLEQNTAALKRWKARFSRAVTMLNKLERQRKRLESKAPKPIVPSVYAKVVIDDTVVKKSKPEPKPKAEMFTPHPMVPAETRVGFVEVKEKAEIDTSIPSFLKRNPDPVAEQIKSEQAETKKLKAKGRIEKMKAKKRGDLKKMPLSGKAALDLIDNG
jgi:hypothetical protein